MQTSLNIGGVQPGTGGTLQAARIAKESVSDPCREHLALAHPADVSAVVIAGQNLANAFDGFASRARSEGPAAVLPGTVMQFGPTQQVTGDATTVHVPA